MEKKQIQITIAGLAGAGKATLANYIVNILRDDGIAVTTNDDLDPYSFDKLENLLSNADQLEVSINTEHILRQSSESQPTSDEPKPTSVPTNSLTPESSNDKQTWCLYSGDFQR